MLYCLLTALLSPDTRVEQVLNSRGRVHMDMSICVEVFFCMGASILPESMWAEVYVERL